MQAAFLAVALVFASVCAAADKKKQDIQVVETKVRRDNGQFTVDGRVRAVGEKPIRQLVVIFDFLSPEGAVVSSEKTGIEDELLKPGQEASYHAVTRDLVRAVRYRIRAAGAGDRVLRVYNGGPYTIE